jgi:hypothetical protein
MVVLPLLPAAMTLRPVAWRMFEHVSLQGEIVVARIQLR